MNQGKRIYCKLQNILFRVPLASSDNLDRAILTNQSQAVIWAIGPVNSKVILGFL